MKFVMNGALTIGTCDCATNEMDASGGHDLFIFGLRPNSFSKSRGWYNPHWHYENDPESPAALALIFSDYFSAAANSAFPLPCGRPYELPEVEIQLCEMWADPDNPGSEGYLDGDFRMHLANLTSYSLR